MQLFTVYEHIIIHDIVYVHVHVYVHTVVHVPHVLYTVEPPNKGHIGYNINSLVLSFVKRLSSVKLEFVYISLVSNYTVANVKEDP